MPALRNSTKWQMHISGKPHDWSRDPRCWNDQLELLWIWIAVSCYVNYQWICNCSTAFRKYRGKDDAGTFRHLNIEKIRTQQYKFEICLNPATQNQRSGIQFWLRWEVGNNHTCAQK